MVCYNRSGNSRLPGSKIRFWWLVLSHMLLAYHKSFFFFFKIQCTCSPSLSQHHMISLMWFSPCHDVVMICSQAAVLWWQPSLSMKSFLLTSRCMLVREWLAPRIMEGLTTHLYGHLEIKAHFFALLLNMIGLWSVLYMCLNVYMFTKKYWCTRCWGKWGNTQLKEKFSCL